MKDRNVTVVIVGLLLASCGTKAPQEQAKEQPPAAASAPGSAPTAATPAPATGASVTAPAPSAEAAPSVAPEPAAPPQPKMYTVATGTPISVRTMEAVDTKHTRTENEFETTLVSPLVADGRTLAKPGADPTQLDGRHILAPKTNQSQ